MRAMCCLTKQDEAGVPDQLHQGIVVCSRSCERMRSLAYSTREYSQCGI